MRRLSFILTLALPVVIVVSCQKNAKEDLASNNEELITANGNGAPSGAHYNLNLIGVPKGKTADLSTSNGRRIFVPLYGNVKIMLSKGEFDVIDANGTDGTAAFQLPEPDATDDGVTDYSVFIRTLGKPGGSGTMKSCMDADGDLSTTDDSYCSTGEYIVNLTRKKGQSQFQNVTNQLLYVWADIDGDGDIDRTELFDEDFETYWWDYDNSGLKLVQMRFYPGVGTTVLPDPEPVQ